MTKLFNNKEWVAKHQAFLDPKSTQETFWYVVCHHPLFGCVLPIQELNAVKFNGNETLETLSEYADAVTVACCDTFEHESEDYALEESFPRNQTVVGNVAYIALYHPNPSIRNNYLDIISIWRRKCKSQ